MERNGLDGPRTIVKLDAIKRAYVDDLIDLAEMERRVAAFLVVKDTGVSYSTAYVNALPGGQDAFRELERARDEIARLQREAAEVSNDEKRDRHGS